MSNSKHNLLLSACHSGLATTQECERMSHAAGMWACGEHKITRAEILLAETVLARSSVSDAGKSLAVLTAEAQGYKLQAEPMRDSWAPDELAEFEQEDVDAAIHGSEYIGGIKMTVTSGQNIGRKFIVMTTSSGFKRGNRVFPSLAAAAGGYATK